jgi:hypothetical protein
MAPAVLLWDFGDTLVDERWMVRAPATCPTWPAASSGSPSRLAIPSRIAPLAGSPLATRAPGPVRLGS